MKVDEMIFLAAKHILARWLQATSPCWATGSKPWSGSKPWLTPPLTPPLAPSHGSPKSESIVAPKNETMDDARTCGSFASAFGDRCDGLFGNWLDLSPLTPMDLESDEYRYFFGTQAHLTLTLTLTLPLPLTLT